MATLKRARQILKSLADDTRLRIVNLLHNDDANVQELCVALGKNQPLVSKHLTRLRLLGIAGDRREGANVYYSLSKPEDKVYVGLMRSVTIGLSDIAILKDDLKRLKRVRARTAKSGKRSIGMKDA